MASNKLQNINDELSELLSAKQRDAIITVSEETFRHKLLPLAVARYSNVDYDIELTHWQQVTGQLPTNGVRVMRGSKELFITPPLILTPELTFGTSLLTRLKEAEKRESSGLPKGELMDKESLKPNLSVRHLSDALSKWVLIFRLYGIVLDIVDGEGNVTASLNAAVSPKESEEPEQIRKIEYEEDDDDGDIL